MKICGFLSVLASLAQHSPRHRFFFDSARLLGQPHVTRKAGMVYSWDLNSGRIASTAATSHSSRVSYFGLLMDFSLPCLNALSNFIYRHTTSKCAQTQMTSSTSFQTPSGRNNVQITRSSAQQAPYPEKALESIFILARPVDHYNWPGLDLSQSLLSQNGLDEREKLRARFLVWQAHRDRVRIAFAGFDAGAHGVAPRRVSR